MWLRRCAAVLGLVLLIVPSGSALTLIGFWQGELTVGVSTLPGSGPEGPCDQYGACQELRGHAFFDYDISALREKARADEDNVWITLDDKSLQGPATTWRVCGYDGAYQTLGCIQGTDDTQGFLNPGTMHVRLMLYQGAASEFRFGVWSK